MTAMAMALSLLGRGLHNASSPFSLRTDGQTSCHNRASQTSKSALQCRVAAHGQVPHFLKDYYLSPQDTCVPLLPLLPLCAMRRAAVRCLSDRFGGLDAGGGQASGEQASEQASVQSQRVASAPACGASVQSQRAEPARENERWRAGREGCPRLCGPRLRGPRLR